MTREERKQLREAEERVQVYVGLCDVPVEKRDDYTWPRLKQASEDIELYVRDDSPLLLAEIQRLREQCSDLRDKLQYEKNKIPYSKLTEEE